MELSATKDQDIYMNICNSENQYQKWSWTKRTPTTIVN